VTPADLIAAAAREGRLTSVTIAATSEQDVRDRFAQFTDHYAVFAPRWHTLGESRWFGATVFVGGMMVAIETPHERVVSEVAA